MQSAENFITVPSSPIQFHQDCSMELSSNEQALQETLITLATVRQGECLLNLKFGSRLNSKVFEQNDIILWLSFDTIIRAMVNDWEPRVKILKVSAFSDPGDVSGHTVTVVVDWRANNSGNFVSTKIAYPYGTIEGFIL